MPPKKKAAAPRPVTAKERAEILRRHAVGESRNDIAKAMKRSGQTISRIVAAEGLSFARGEQVIAATKARQVDLAALRAELAVDLTLDAIRLRQQLWEPATVFNFGGKENDYNEHHFDQPPAADKRALMATAGMAIDRSYKLAPPADDSGAEAARSMVTQLMSGLADVYREHQQEATADEGDGDAP